MDIIALILAVLALSRFVKHYTKDGLVKFPPPSTTEGKKARFIGLLLVLIYAGLVITVTANDSGSKSGYYTLISVLSGILIVAIPLILKSNKKKK